MRTGQYYVYAHVSYEGYYMYISKGTSDRAYQEHQYIERIDDLYEVKIMAENLTEMEAVAIEKALVRLHQPFCSPREAIVLPIGTEQQLIEAI